MEPTQPAWADHERVWTIVVAGGSGARFGHPAIHRGRRCPDRRPFDGDCAGGVGRCGPGRPGRRRRARRRGGGRRDTQRVGACRPWPPCPMTRTIGARPRRRPTVREREPLLEGDRRGACWRRRRDPGVPVADTIKVVGSAPATAPDPAVRPAGGVGAGPPPATAAGRPVLSTPERSTLVAVQTPQGFRAEVLRAPRRRW